MKIAIFSDTYLPQVNGVANVVYQSAKNLAALGHDVWIFTVCQKSQTKFFWTEEKIAVTILPSIPAGVYRGERFTLPVGIAFRRLKEFQPDVIHTHTPFSVGWEAVWAAKKLKKPLVGTHHTFYDHYLKHIKADYKWVKKISWKYTTLFYNFCDLVLSPSLSLAQALTQKGLKKPIEVLQNSIETEIFVPAPNGETKDNLKKEFGIKNKSLVYMGRVSYEKSIDQVLKAFKLVVEKEPQTTLMIVGDGPERKNLEELAAKIGVKNKVIFTGLLRGENLVRALQASDVFVTASKSENMPLSVLEAMSCGLPFVAAAEKGLVELIKDGVNGFLVKADNPTDIAEKVLRLITNESMLKKFSDASRVQAMNYSKETVTALLEQNYKKAIQSKI
ncbi:glycosyltransferase [Patescibacteria group bacterium]|nr:glycosyltransferase [Patescibacteria group bacterium]